MGLMYGFTTETLDYYESNAAKFRKDTADADMSEIMAEFTALLPEGGCVLDWGCGTGRDSRALLDMGYSVVSADASAEMRRVAEELFGIGIRREAFGELGEEGAFDGIWANASLLHVPKEELPGVFQIAHRALKESGVLYASFKLGGFEGMRNGRWLTDLGEESLSELLQPCFDIVQMRVTDDVRPERSGEKWLDSLSRRRS